MPRAGPVEGAADRRLGGRAGMAGGGGRQRGGSLFLSTRSTGTAYEVLGLGFFNRKMGAMMGLSGTSVCLALEKAASQRGRGWGGPRVESECKDVLSGGAACAQTPGRGEMREAVRAPRSARCFPPLFPVA